MQRSRRNGQKTNNNNCDVSTRCTAGMKVAIKRITIVKFSDAYRDLHKRTHVANCSNSTTRALHLQEHQIFRNQHLIAFCTRFLLCCFVAEQDQKRTLFLCHCCVCRCCCYTFIWQQQLNAHNANMVIGEIDTISSVCAIRKLQCNAAKEETSEGGKP